MPNYQNTNLPNKLAKPAQRALASAGISTIEQLTSWTETELMKLHGMGPKAMGQLLDALKEKGLSFKK
ncbi:helix-hairpin-helix domain-containing protein [Fictibacillus sp. b24]|uniref:helix-hairpin-helix domain-containing protein n=1 Tax=unclassified Fictibacillus TaxID=2644029 RepID=UPI0025A09167|nr:helix-hairpin-helix domain-containing protein [Fictibacillus sp. b24]MDM5317123.1 helix-hairpin-helix domain-containing protein [Fictibacillus sp. b24]